MILVLLRQRIILQENFNLRRHLRRDILASNSQRNTNNTKRKGRKCRVSNLLVSFE